jgi:hypothetical protein
MNPEYTHIEELDMIYSEMYKGLHGFEHRSIKFSSVEEGQAALAKLGVALEAQMKKEEEAEKSAIIKFEALILNLINCGAKTRETAIFWLNDEETESDMECLAYKHGLPYGYFGR